MTSPIRDKYFISLRLKKTKKKQRRCHYIILKVSEAKLCILLQVLEEVWQVLEAKALYPSASVGGGLASIEAKLYILLQVLEEVWQVLRPSFYILLQVLEAKLSILLQV